MKLHTARILIVGLILLVVVALLAEESDKYFTDEMSNGRAWGLMVKFGKMPYLGGFRDGVQVALGITGQSKIPPELDYGGFTLEELSKQIDDFYSDNSNIRIPIPWALMYVGKKAKGAKTAELADFAATLRQMSSDAK